ncbi:MAG: hypothetical protein L6R35_007352, partial [Caloplaca aegaea]
IKIATLLGGLRGGMREHAELNAASYRSYEELATWAVSYSRYKQVRGDSKDRAPEQDGSAPMDVGYVGKGDKSKGKGKGKSKGKGKKGKGKGGGKAKGKGPKGKGKGGKSGNRSFTGTCHNCGKVGHMARECRSAPKVFGIYDQNDIAEDDCVLMIGSDEQPWNQEEEWQDQPWESEEWDPDEDPDDGWYEDGEYEGTWSSSRAHGGWQQGEDFGWYRGQPQDSVYSVQEEDAASEAANPDERHQPIAFATSSSSQEPTKKKKTFAEAFREASSEMTAKPPSEAQEKSFGRLHRQELTRLGKGKGSMRQVEQPEKQSEEQHEQHAERLADQESQHEQTDQHEQLEEQVDQEPQSRSTEELAKEYQVLVLTQHSPIAQAGDESAIPLIVDSGAYAHVCPRMFGVPSGVNVVESTKGNNTVAATGKQLRYFGQRKVQICIAGKAYCIQFQVHDVKHVILSVSALVRNGSAVQFSRGIDGDPQVGIVTRDGSKLIAKSSQNVFVIWGYRSGTANRQVGQVVMPVTEAQAAEAEAAKTRAAIEGDEARQPRK